MSVETSSIPATTKSLQPQEILETNVETSISQTIPALQQTTVSPAVVSTSSIQPLALQWTESNVSTRKQSYVPTPTAWLLQKPGESGKCQVVYIIALVEGICLNFTANSLKYLWIIGIAGSLLIIGFCLVGCSLLLYNTKSRRKR